ncbi:hypothetical protein MGG_15981 [Pyricularia oryzae 70-15]|uniref:Uncharacterized protein n=1 Tax=Pyricularia oryzae (strain 70-15 / ATCC MYA-4617 / FGSC 8958) TaxID=242507 RepID=G4MXX7_PYRO7|nr:uncharacterized protein MGG_15981 [Pyricularia oryzae 70-15]XP_003719141.1 uncharacterized protein MGG_17555 [Pyricularia oryzae 70-15]EHA49557.1 hypothetical protein MGG_17555 [Pyricularia oryzae 70-15]EHA56067.1 hypothetical protein MGG_15981 [Pyricularia oryzae 70-15]
MALFPVANAVGGKQVHSINTESTLNGCLVTLRQRTNGGPANHPVKSEARYIRLNQSVHVGGHLITVGEHCYDVTASNLPANWYPHILPAESTTIGSSQGPITDLHPACDSTRLLRLVRV